MPKDLTKVRIFRLTPTDEYLANPHKGCCTFQRFNGDPLNPGVTWREDGPRKFPPSVIPEPEPQVIDGYLPTTVAYCRWFWTVLEPQPGNYDFSMIDNALKICEERGQTLAVRLMPFGHFPTGQPGLPDWYAATGAPLTAYHEAENTIPVYDSEEYFEHFGNLIKEFGKRYDNNRLLESIDVAYLGPWGEGEGFCSQETCERFAALFAESLPDTPKLSLIAGDINYPDQFLAGINNKFGWRADCFGDLRQSALDFLPLNGGKNHMFTYYPRRVCEINAHEAWKYSPVHMESCFVPMMWYNNNFDIDFIIQQGSKYHTSYFMPKSTRLPAAWMEKLATFCNNIGYRFVFRQAIFTKATTAGSTLHCRFWIENIGVAPLYHKYDFAIRLRQDQNEKIIILKKHDSRTWLPGDIWIDEEISIPSTFRPGAVEIAAGLIDTVSRKAKINFAVEERFPDRWVNLGYTEIRDDNDNRLNQ